ncbi:MAG: type II toxin-antitoxin system PemK/MazF family toxin [Capsulimonadaceae bacterium]
MSNTKSPEGRISRGDIYWVDFTGRGVEQQGMRPALVVQNDMSNATAAYGITVVVPLSSKLKRYPSNVIVQPSPENGLSVPSDIVVGQVAAVIKSSLGERIGTLGAADMARVERILALVLGLS